MMYSRAGHPLPVKGSAWQIKESESSFLSMESEQGIEKNQVFNKISQDNVKCVNLIHCCYIDCIPGATYFWSLHQQMCPFHMTGRD